ncbi:MAG: DUF167 domain-containing protein [Vicinamibacterales bacterium]
MSPAPRPVPPVVRLDLRVVPRASRNAIDGLREGRLVVRVTAPPVDRAANDAVVRLVAEALGLPRRDVTLVRGETGRNKTVEIRGLGEAAVRERLGMGDAGRDTEGGVGGGRGDDGGKRRGDAGGRRGG